MENLLWVEQYRPKSIDECILPKSIKKTFKEFVKNKELPNLLLSGGAGEVRLQWQELCVVS